jgi:hypothetical protein
MNFHLKKKTLKSKRETPQSPTERNTTQKMTPIKMNKKIKNTNTKNNGTSERILSAKKEQPLKTTAQIFSEKSFKLIEPQKYQTHTRLISLKKIIDFS